jgi:hypothetical protein
MCATLMRTLFNSLAVHARTRILFTINFYLG